MKQFGETTMSIFLDPLPGWIICVKTLVSALHQHG